MIRGAPRSTSGWTLDDDGSESWVAGRTSRAFVRFDRFVVVLVVVLYGVAAQPAASRRALPASFANDLSLSDVQDSPDIFFRDDVHPSKAERRFDIEEHRLGDETTCGGVYERTRTGEVKIVPIRIRRLVELAQLRNCTVIEGSLEISFLDDARDHVTRLAFPKLIEITGYALFYRVKGLTTFSKLFPNLIALGGQRLYEDRYALVVYECFQLNDLGFSDLTVIKRGAVRIEKNPQLCYLETVEWDRLQSGLLAGSYIDGNQNSTICRTRFCHKSCTSRCWTARPEGCQKLCPQRCLERGEFCPLDGRRSSNLLPDDDDQDEDVDCCGSQCLGGCVRASTDNGPTHHCLACKRFHYLGDCVESCPEGTFEFEGRRCVSWEECVNTTLRYVKTGADQTTIRIQDILIPEKRFKAHDGKCLEFCPLGFTPRADDPRFCEKCPGVCSKVCAGIKITKTEQLERLRGCTKIVGTLQISIRGVDDTIALPALLEQSLGLVEEIVGQLQVSRTDSLVSLDFLRSLRKISGPVGSKKPEQVIVVKNNPHLLTVFDLERREREKKLVRIENGHPLFHFNSRLCYRNIVDFLVNAGYPEEKIDDYEVNKENNGDQISCQLNRLQVKVIAYKKSSVIYEFDNLYSSPNFTDKRSLLGYLVSYKEAPFRNVSMFDGKDACSKDAWEQIDLKAKDKQNGPKRYGLFARLKHFTQYAFYVEADTIKTKHDQGAISDIVYFRTVPSTPSPPGMLEARASSSVDIGKSHGLRLRWTKPLRPQGNVTHYVISWRQLSLEAASITRIAGVCDAEQEPKPLVNSLPGKSSSSLDLSSTRSPSSLSPSSCDCDAVCDARGATPPRPPTPDPKATRRDEIAFGDALLNYMIRRNPSAGRGSRRRTRSAVNETLDTPMTPSSTNGSMSEDDLLFSSVNVSSAITEFTISNLSHYSQYRIEIFACHDQVVQDPENDWGDVQYPRCSEPAFASAWTDPIPSYDRIDESSIDVEVLNRTRADDALRDAFVKWTEPTRVNGRIEKFDLRVNLVGGREHLPLCVPYWEYLSASGYRLKELTPGNYSLQLRATSLGGRSGWTKPKFFVVEDDSEGMRTDVVIIVVIVAMLLALIGSLSYIAHKKIHAPPQIPSHVYSTVNPDYIGIPYEADEWEIERECLEIGAEIGAGHYGCVFKGFVKNLKGKPARLPCAIKTTKVDATYHDRMEFLNEGNVMKKYRSNHVIELYGILSQTQPVCIVMELMEYGDLKTFLRCHREDAEEPVTPPLLTEGAFGRMATDIADGMAYLMSRRHVHRDLAARNVMIGTGLVAKVADFGLSREIYEDDYYRNARRGFLPVRWMSPESLHDGVFSHESDVWSFGIVLWEMATLAAQPYSGLSNEEVNVGVQRGVRLETPEVFPTSLRRLMEACFATRPRDRPTFLQIVDRLRELAGPDFRTNSFYHSREGQIYRIFQSVEKAGGKPTEVDWDTISLTPTIVSEFAESDDETWVDLPPDIAFSAGGQKKEVMRIVAEACRHYKRRAVKRSSVPAEDADDFPSFSSALYPGAVPPAPATVAAAVAAFSTSPVPTVPEFSDFEAAKKEPDRSPLKCLFADDFYMPVEDRGCGLAPDSTSSVQTFPPSDADAYVVPVKSIDPTIDAAFFSGPSSIESVGDGGSVISRPRPSHPPRRERLRPPSSPAYGRGGAAPSIDSGDDDSWAGRRATDSRPRGGSHSSSGVGSWSTKTANSSGADSLIEIDGYVPLRGAGGGDGSTKC